MRRLTLVREREQGAIATIVAMLFFFGVMLALAALTVDVGNINADRRQLQNGADAVALAVAQQCAQDGTCKPIDPVTYVLDTNLQTLANANAADNATEIRRVDGQRPVGTPVGTPAICGNGPGLFACPPASIQSTPDLQECPAPTTSLATGVNWVRVYTETKQAGTGTHILPYSFGAAVAGVGSGADQQACAAVAWGQVSITASVPLTLSACEWKRATANGTYYAPPPSGASPFYGGAAPQAAWPIAARTPPLTTLPAPALTEPIYPTRGQEVVIFLQNHEMTIPGTNPPVPYDSSCFIGSSSTGHDAPGSFGWVDSTNCLLNISTSNWVKTNTGGDTPNPCKDVMVADWKHIIFLPVFDCAADGIQTGPVPDPLPTTNWCETGMGGNTYYHIKGWARFYLSGYHLPSDDKVSPASGIVPCGGGDRCMSGWFLQGLVDAPVTVTTPDSNFGVNGIQLVN